MQFNIKNETFEKIEMKDVVISVSLTKSSEHSEYLTGSYINDEWVNFYWKPSLVVKRKFCSIICDKYDAKTGELNPHNDADTNRTSIKIEENNNMIWSDGGYSPGGSRLFQIVNHMPPLAVARHFLPEVFEQRAV